MPKEISTKVYIIALVIAVLLVLLGYALAKATTTSHTIHIEVKDKRHTKENYDDYMSLGF